MKRVFKLVSVILATISLTACFSLFGCAEKEKYALTVSGGELLYEDLKDGYKAGEEVKVKVKITPNINTVAYLDSEPLTKEKNASDDYYTFAFTMPEKPAALKIENLKGFKENLLTGFHLTFYKDGNSIDGLNGELESANAVADYYYYYGEAGHDVFTSNDGADVFADGKISVHSAAYGLSGFKLEDTLYYTYELTDAIIGVNWVYLNQQTGEISLSSSAGYALNAGVISSTFNKQSLSETRYNYSGEEYEAVYESEIGINFKFTDYLTGVKVLEFDKDNQLIKSSEITDENRAEAFTVGGACEYAVIEEEYTVMNDGVNNGEKRYERTLINKSATGDGKTLKFPRGDGLISPVYLSVKWAE